MRAAFQHRRLDREHADGQRPPPAHPRPRGSPRRRVRGMAKWTGVVLCAAVLAGWLLTLRWGIGWVRGRSIFGVTRGCIAYVRDDGLSLPEGWARERSGEPIWVPTRDPNAGRAAYALPLWIALLLFVVPTAWCWLTDRRPFPPGRCPECGYDLTGNVSGRCPECGAEAAWSRR
jgi:hypothetical protein